MSNQPLTKPAPVDKDCLDPATAKQAAEAIYQLEDVLLDAQQTLAERLPEADAEGTVSEIAGIVDGPKQRAAQDAAHKAVAKLARAARR